MTMHHEQPSSPSLRSLPSRLLLPPAHRTRLTSFALGLILLLDQLGACLQTPPRDPPWTNSSSSISSSMAPPVSSSSSSSLHRRHASESAESMLASPLSSPSPFPSSSLPSSSSSSGGEENQCLGEERAKAIDEFICNGTTTRSAHGPFGKDSRIARLRDARLSFCSSFSAFFAIDRGQHDINSMSRSDCLACFQSLLQREASARQAYEDFLLVMARFDCAEQFSRWSCDSCKKAYKDWLCAEAFELPFYHHSRRLPPCPDYCRRVEKQCPYFLPHYDSQYAGEPHFLCTDYDDIPEQVDALQDSTLCHRPCQDNSVQEAICPHNYTKHTSSSAPLHSSAPAPPPSSSLPNRTLQRADSSSSAGTSGGARTASAPTSFMFAQLVWLLCTCLMCRTGGLQLV